jgi:hypothetical protein
MTAMRVSSRPAAALETTSHNLAGGCRAIDQWEARDAREQQSPISGGAVMETGYVSSRRTAAGIRRIAGLPAPYIYPHRPLYT